MWYLCFLFIKSQISKNKFILGLPSPLSRLGRERREILYSQTRMLNKWSGGGVGTLVSPQFPIWIFLLLLVGPGTPDLCLLCKQGRHYWQAFPLSGHTPYSLFSLINAYSFIKAPLKLPFSVKPSLTAEELACLSTVIPQHPLWTSTTDHWEKHPNVFHVCLSQSQNSRLL